MTLTAAAATFVAVLPAELPDKTILACLILSSRYRPSIVFGGAATAFLAQVVIAVAAGGALSLLPHHVVEACAAGVFAIGAVLLWMHREKQDDDEDEDSGMDGMRSEFWPVFGTAFAVVFLAEFGDLTQFLTVSRRLLKLIPMQWLTRGAAVVMLALAATSAYAAAS
jgi:Ca2+/H+ antiporter, TMEM165/GDT1 family